MQRYHITTRWIYVPLLLASILAFPGCWDFDNASNTQPTCQGTFEHFYDQGCVLTSGGTPLTEWQSVDYCDDWTTWAEGCGCGYGLDNLLRCLNDIPAEQCYSCDSEFTTFLTCWNACGSN